MSIDLLILAFLMLLFCIAMQIVTIKTLFSVFNAVRPKEVREIKPINLIEKEEKSHIEIKSAETERDEAIMRNLDIYDGTPFGQEEVR